MIGRAASLLLLLAGVGAAAEPLATPASPFNIKDEQGRILSLLSAEAFRAEFRHLRRVFRQTDLAGPAVQTDGWNFNIAEAEWPLMGFAYFGYACANLAKSDPQIREQALSEMRWLMEALQMPRLSGFMAPHTGVPFGSNQISASVFVHGHFLNLAMRYREVSADLRYDRIIHQVAKALADAFAASDQGLLRSYTNMWWITDNFPALSALVRYDRAFQSQRSEVKSRFLNSLKAQYLDTKTGLFCTYADPASRTPLQGARGISVMYGLHFLRDFEPEFVAGQYALAKKLFVRDVLGLTAVREFPEGSGDKGDIDSGPLVFGLGPSASGFAIAAAALNGDEETARKLMRAATAVGMPVLHDGELSYTIMPPVGQAVILFGKTLLPMTSPPEQTK